MLGRVVGMPDSKFRGTPPIQPYIQLAALYRITSADTITMPTTGNQHVGFLPFWVLSPSVIDTIYLAGGNALATSGGQARIALAIYDENTSTHNPNNLLWSENFNIIGGASPKIQTASSYKWMCSLGSFQTWIAEINNLTNAPKLDPGKMYYIGVHFEPTFTAGNAYAIQRPPGLQVRRLAAGATAWPYAWATNPSLEIQFSSEQVARPDLVFKMRPA